MLIGFLVIPLSKQTDNRDIADANKQLQEIKEAIIGFAMANGRLPCPAQLNSNGLESPVGGGNCTNAGRGFVPAATLGLSGRFSCEGLLLDPWNNIYRYSVTQTNAGGAVSADFTTAGDMSSVTMVALSPNLSVCNDTACATTYTTGAVAVVFSMGKDWRTYTSNIQMENAGEGGTSATSNCGNNTVYNLPNNNTYIYHEVSVQNNQEFDDQLIWIPSTIIYSKMVTAGKLP